MEYIGILCGEKKCTNTHFNLNGLFTATLHFFDWLKIQDGWTLNLYKIVTYRLSFIYMEYTKTKYQCRHTVRLTNTHAHTGARTPIHSCTQCSTRDTASLFRVCVRVRVCDSVGGGVAVVVIVAATNRMKRTRFGVSGDPLWWLFLYSVIHLYKFFICWTNKIKRKKGEKKHKLHDFFWIIVILFSKRYFLYINWIYMRISTSRTLSLHLSSHIFRHLALICK